MASEAAAAEEAPGRGAQKDGQWAHRLAAPEQGCVLLAHPALFSASQNYFSRAVIFLFEHSDKGSAGVILNRPTDKKMDLLLRGVGSLAMFGDQPLYMGGDVGEAAVTVVHGYPQLAGSREIVPGVAMGGVEAAAAAVGAGAASASDFRFFSKYCGWGPGCAPPCRAVPAATSCSSCGLCLMLLFAF